MKKILLIIVFSLLGFTLTTQSILAKEIEEGIEFEVKYFETYEELQEYKASKEEISIAPYQTRLNYHFGATSFSNYVDVRNGFAFYNLSSADIESLDRKSYEIRIYDSQDNYVGKAVSPAVSGWIHTDFTVLPRGKSYKLRFYNPGSGTMRLVQGDIRYY